MLKTASIDEATEPGAERIGRAQPQPTQTISADRYEAGDERPVGQVLNLLNGLKIF
jgi:hypothetical protein